MCYVVSIVAAAATSLVRGRSVKLWWLTLMLCGGAIFGVIDHLWNGELFLISANTPKDLILGGVIVITTILLWAMILLLAKFRAGLSQLQSKKIKIV